MFVISVCVVPTVHGNYCPVNQSCWTKQLSHVHDAWRCDHVSSAWSRVVLSHRLCSSCVYRKVHTSSIIAHLEKCWSLMPSRAVCCQWKSTQASPVTNCVFFLKGLQWMSATQVSQPNKLQNHLFCLRNMFIYNVYITYGVQLCQVLLQQLHGNLDSIV